MPASIDVIAPDIRIEETMTPCKVAEKFPKVSMNEGIVVTEPIVPVSSLEFGQHR
jgi:hypothetical protein